MPFIHVQTNQSTADAKSFLKKLSIISAKAIGKPEAYIQTALEADSEMTFAGTDDPTAFIQCKSIGLNDSITESISAAISSFCEIELSIPKDRIYIEFVGVTGKMWGWKGATF